MSPKKSVFVVLPLIVAACAGEPKGLPPGTSMNVDSHGNVQLTGKVPPGVALKADKAGRLHLTHQVFMTGSQTDIANERIAEGFENPTVGKGSDWPFYVMKTELSCPYNWTLGAFGKSHTLLSPVAPSAGSTRDHDIYPGHDVTVSGNTFIDYAGRSHLVFGVFVNDVGVYRSTIPFTPRTGPVEIGSYKFYINPAETCKAKVSLLPGPKMISYIAWLQNSGRFPWDYEGGTTTSLNGDGGTGGMYDPVNPMTGGMGKSINPDNR